MDICGFWAAVLQQDREALPVYFREDAWVNWPNTNEHFTAAEFIRVNCDYPGRWDGQVERIVAHGDQIITVAHVYDREKTISCHAVSFIHIKDGKIQSMEEYWGDDGQPPLWRKEMKVGTPILKG